MKASAPGAAASRAADADTVLEPIAPFSIARLPRIEFGAGSLARLPTLIQGYGRRLALVTGARSFLTSRFGAALLAALRQAGLQWQQITVDGEPSPQLVDEAARELRAFAPELVVGIGGGSVLDAAKAIAGLVRVEHSVMDFLEGIGPELPYPGPALPFIAVPTTAGTGSEATKNAVLGVQGVQGFKKSFRHERLVPEVALIDPDLLENCPQPQIAANAMDALTQLMESYVSLRANPFTDALAESGVRAIREGLWAWYKETDQAAAGRARLAYGALLSGICLAQTGLGAVHGLAAPLGAFFPIPHGVVCGTLLAVTTRTNIAALRSRDPDSPARDKYARLGNLLTGRQHQNARNAREALCLLLEDWIEELQLPRLSAYGMTEADIPRVVANARGSSMKTNPIVLSDEELAEILRQRL
ncbi:MAG TPA: iron-containing alcohol dehydrogenase [Candidatus Competibacteraceae bacterium]|nr:iron-containing alcohol dehydrogenase [Candidatus Competibacteraceae bacterium]